MPPITAVIFDMYETLVQDRNDTWRRSFRAIVEDQGLATTPEKLWEHFRKADAENRRARTDPSRPFRSYREAWERAFRASFADLGLDGDAAAATRHFFIDLAQRKPYPEATEAVRRVQADYRIAVLSNADNGYLMPNLALLDLEFEAVLSSETARVYKPLPGLFEAMLRSLGVAATETVYVGDRQYEDVLGAAGVGINPVWINRDGRPLDPELPAPDHQISSLLELPALLAGNFASKKE
jgi:2-haloalkanoic acid dehalogenase type II